MHSCVYLLVAVMLIGIAMESVDSSNCEEPNDRPLTDALKEKWGIMFDLNDIDNDGVYDVEDEFAFSQRLIDAYNASGDQINGFRQFPLLYKDVVEAYYGVNSGKTALTRPEYITALSSYWIHHYNLFKQRTLISLTTIFHAVDSDDDGLVNFEEFQKAYILMSDADEKDAKKAFKFIDSDGNGDIDEDEFIDIHLTFVLDPFITAKEVPLY